MAARSSFTVSLEFDWLLSLSSIPFNQWELSKGHGAVVLLQTELKRVRLVTQHHFKVRMKLKENTSKKRQHHDRSTSWNKSLKEIRCFLPISDTESGRALTKKETLVHMLQYFDFLQTHIQRLQSRLPAACLTDANDRESESESEASAHSDPGTPPRTLKAKRKYSFGRTRKKVTLHPGRCDDKKQSQEDPLTTTKPEWTPDAEALPSSSDSGGTFASLVPTASSSRAESSTDQESPCQGLGSQCSVCDDRTGSEDGSQDLVSSPSQPFLLRDRMLGVLPPLGMNSLPDSPSLPHTPTFPFLPLLGVKDGLNLSPSLLTSPARGLSQDLLPEGQEELQTLFEDVWVNPKPSVPRVPRLPRGSGHGSRKPGSRALGSSQSDDEQVLDDVNWTPKQHLVLKKVSKVEHKRRSNKKQPASASSLKKKCVNGFIMFCRLNRKLYLGTHPGTPSSVVTKELADLWHIMPKQERRVYCLKARHFSRQHNRNVRSKGQDEEDEEQAENWVPSPLHILLAHRDLRFGSTGKL